jgi:hypothetical protein
MSLWYSIWTSLFEFTRQPTVVRVVDEDRPLEISLTPAVAQSSLVHCLTPPPPGLSVDP